MIALYWNIRGIQNVDSQNALKILCLKHKPDLLFISEPFVSFHQIPSYFWLSIGMQLISLNHRPDKLPNLWAFKTINSPQHALIAASCQHITFSIKYSNTPVIISAIYAHNDHRNRRILWEELTSIHSNQQSPWLVIGDFNSVLGAHEKRGGRPPLAASCLEFQAFSDTCNLVHINSTGLFFTWSKNISPNIDSRLDRAMCSPNMFDEWQSVSCATLNKFRSDHTPLLFKAENDIISGPKPFRFLSAWTFHQNFEELVTLSWSKPVLSSCPMVSFQLKLKQLKSDLKTWNKEVFGNIQEMVSKATEELLSIQLYIDSSGHTPQLDRLEAKAQAKLSQALHTQERFWKEKSRVNWLKDGDKNTAFFHRIAKQKWASNRINALKIDGNTISNSSQLKDHITNHFQNLYSSQNCISNHQLVDQVIPQLVTTADNDILGSIPSNEEIKKAVFALNPNSAPGPDGFPGSMYQKCWHIVGMDVCKAIKVFFLHNWITPGLNSNFITPIPKIPNADTITNFRPIALANFIFKIIPKILSDRLASIAPKLISHQQNGFVRGRQIHNSIGITSECFNMLDRKNHGGNIAIKIDIAKAFDTLDWDFLLKVLQAFGFCSTFIKWINSILQSAKLSILINGSPCGYFSCSRGVRQGDPLSPILFCLAEEVLSRLICLHSSKGSLKPISSPKSCSAPTHSLYADDVMLFYRGDKKNLLLVLKILQDYSNASGQFINYSKSRIFFGETG